MNAAQQQVVKRTPNLIFDRIRFAFANQDYPFEQDAEAAATNRSRIPIPPDPEGHFRIELANRFTPRDPEPGEERDLIAVTIIKAILYPSDKLKTALAGNSRFNRVLAASTRDVMTGADGETRRDLFLRGIGAACAVTAQENRIVGAILKNLFESAKGDLADCVATLLAIHIGTRSGDRVSRQLLKVAGYGPVSEQDIQTIARRLPIEYSDFRIYHRTLKEVDESLVHIIEADNHHGMAPSGSALTQLGQDSKSDTKLTP